MAWSYIIAGLGIAGLLVAANRPKLGWSLNIAAQGLWLVYATVTSQWGFMASACVYAIAYWRLLRRAQAREVVQ